MDDSVMVISGPERTDCAAVAAASDAASRLCPSTASCSDGWSSNDNGDCDNSKSNNNSNSRCSSNTRSAPVSASRDCGISRTAILEGVRWWCQTTCQRWLEESAFLGVLIMRHPTLLLVLCASLVFRIAGACSSRSTPRPRPPSPTVRPNITFQTYACPEAYAKWYCLNGATCFSVKIGESILYNCECADGYVGQRCEFKDLEGSYLASRQQVMIETASIAGGVTLLILIIVILSVAVYVHYKRKRKERMQPHQIIRAYQPFGSFRESETNGHTRPLRATDPESGRRNHGESVASSLLNPSNRSRTIQ